MLIDLSQQLDFSDIHETKLLAALVREPSLLDGHRDAISPNMFVHPEKRLIASFIIQHFDKYRTVPDPDTVDEYIHQEVKARQGQGEDRMLRLLSSAIRTVNLSDSKKVIDDTLNHSVMMGVVNAVRKHLRPGLSSQEIDQMLEDVRKAQALSENKKDLGGSLFEDFSRFLWSRTANMCPTGISGLDEALGGGLGHGEFGVVVAGWKSCKTWLMTNFGIAALKAGYDVVHVSTEMPERQGLLRYDSVLHGKMPSQYQFEEIVEVLKSYSDKVKRNLYFKFFPGGTCSPTVLHSYIRNLIHEKKIDPANRPFLLIVDYPTKMTPSAGDGNQRFNVAANFAACQRVAQEYQMPCWVPAQANRGGNQKRNHDAADMAETIIPIQDADLILNLHLSAEEKEQGMMDIQISEARYVPDDVVIRAMVDFETGRISGF